MGATKGTVRRRCYFCDQVGKASKEHAWPEWMEDDADVLPTRIDTSIGFARTAEDTFTEAPNIQRQRQGSVLTVGPREVCEPCNSGWMSQLETRTRPILEDLWSGQPTKLTSTDAAVLARWAVKTAWMHERSRGPNPTANFEQRQAVMADRHPPLTRVWLGRYVGEHDFNAPILRTELGHQRQAWDSDDKARAMLAMLLFHGLALMIRTDSRQGIPRLQVNERAWLSLAPRTSRGRLSFPPLPLTDEDIRRRILNHRDWAILPDLPRFERDSRGWMERVPRGRNY